jgi:hypothetical protein
VPITIFSPGIAKSEMTDGKFMKPDGTVAGYEEGVALRRVRLSNHSLEFLAMRFLRLKPWMTIALCLTSVTQPLNPSVI